MPITALFLLLVAAPAVAASPVFKPKSYAIELREDAGIDSAVVTVVATDTDAGDTITYSIKAGGNAGGAFSVDPSSGAITLQKELDYESVRKYSLTVEATDGALTATALVIITVLELVPDPDKVPCMLEEDDVWDRQKLILTKSLDEVIKKATLTLEQNQWYNYYILDRLEVGGSFGRGLTIENDLSAVIPITTTTDKDVSTYALAYKFPLGTLTRANREKKISEADKVLAMLSKDKTERTAQTKLRGLFSDFKAGKAAYLTCCALKNKPSGCEKNGYDLRKLALQLLISVDEGKVSGSCFNSWKAFQPVGTSTCPSPDAAP